MDLFKSSLHVTQVNSSAVCIWWNRVQILVNTISWCFNEFTFVALLHGWEQWTTDSPMVLPSKSQFAQKNIHLLLTSHHIVLTIITKVKTFQVSLLDVILRQGYWGLSPCLSVASIVRHTVSEMSVKQQSIGSWSILLSLRCYVFFHSVWMNIILLLTSPLITDSSPPCPNLCPTCVIVCPALITFTCSSLFPSP